MNDIKWSIRKVGISSSDDYLLPLPYYTIFNRRIIQYSWMAFTAGKDGSV